MPSSRKSDPKRTMNMTKIAPRMISAALAATTVLLMRQAHVSAQDRAEIIERCRAEYGHMGPGQVKYCADNDIEAAEALAAYPTVR
jgi:hypothetical protein